MTAENVEADDRSSAVLLGGALLGGAALLALPRVSHAVSVGHPGTFSVRTFGALGNDVADDTAAAQAAINAALDAGGGAVYFPPGQYRITSTLRVSQVRPITIIGDGASSTVRWAFDGPLIEWTVDCIDCSVRDLLVTAFASMQASRAMISSTTAMKRTILGNLSLFGFEGVFFPASGIDMGPVAEQNVVFNCNMFGVRGTGIKIGRGFDVLVVGGRIFGNPDLSTLDGARGIHLTGGCNAVRVFNASIALVNEALRIADDSGAGTNGQVLLGHVVLDSSIMGLHILDSSFVSWSGCWAASSALFNIGIEFGNPVVVITGGTIFNAGAVRTISSSFGVNGMVVNSGSFVLKGVTIRNNKDAGILVPNANVRDYSITACRIAANGRGVVLGGSNYVCSGNVFALNRAPNAFFGTATVVNNNLVR